MSDWKSQLINLSDADKENCIAEMFRTNAFQWPEMWIPPLLRLLNDETGSETQPPLSKIHPALIKIQAACFGDQWELVSRVRDQVNFSAEDYHDYINNIQPERFAKLGIPDMYNYEYKEWREQMAQIIYYANSVIDNLISPSVVAYLDIKNALPQACALIPEAASSETSSAKYKTADDAVKELVRYRPQFRQVCSHFLATTRTRFYFLSEIQTTSDTYANPGNNVQSEWKFYEKNCDSPGLTEKQMDDFFRDMKGSISPYCVKASYNRNPSGPDYGFYLSAVCTTSVPASFITIDNVNYAAVPYHDFQIGGRKITSFKWWYMAFSTGKELTDFMNKQPDEGFIYLSKLVTFYGYDQMYYYLFIPTAQTD